MTWSTPLALSKEFGISQHTLRNWSNHGHIGCVRGHNGTGKRYYDRESVCKFLRVHDTQKKERQHILYARVSSLKQQKDLDRQVQDLQEAFPKHEVITDIGSGLNYAKPGLQSLLQRVCKGLVEEVVVTHKDRLCRYGYELVETLCQSLGTKLVVHHQDAEERNDECRARELADDLLSIVTVFVAKHNGRRSAANRKRRKTHAQDPTVPKPGATAKNQAVDRDS